MSEFQVAGGSGRSKKESVVVRIRQVFATDINAYGAEIQTGMGVQQCVKRLVESVVLAPIDFSGSRGIHAEEIAFYRLLNLFMDDSGRYEIAKPLLDKCYIEELEVKKTEGEKLNKLASCLTIIGLLLLISAAVLF